MKIYHLLCAAAFFSLSVFAAQAQNQPLSPEEQEKRILEYVDARTQKLSTLLELEYWQEFYVDSTLTHDIKAMWEESSKMQAAKVENRDLFIAVEDKWEQQIDDSFKRFFTEEQWKKYWKSGAERAWKARQKRKK
ncbi:MAG: hypothetical protein E7109_07060 [Bacteroidales bacterium]|jgi:hypothetical protein|nr:hypothetical protein [Bacteroidales bacterium]